MSGSTKVVMDSLDEQFVVEQIKSKLEKGFKLTEREQIILAYSPYGTARSCGCKL